MLNDWNWMVDKIRRLHQLRETQVTLREYTEDAAVASGDALALHAKLVRRDRLGMNRTQHRGQYRLSAKVSTVAQTNGTAIA
jgi:hypothetical protein